MNRRRASMIFVALAACLIATFAIVALERQRAGLVVEQRWLASSPATVWRPADAGVKPLVVIAHGYAGSRQLMQPLAITLARAGFFVVAFDFYGHGRHREMMDGDITSLEGATAQLVDQTASVVRAARGLAGASGPVALVGHSMATDIVVRTAAQIEDPAAIVAISMYSEAVEPNFPERLLIVSGAQEAGLREVALDRLRQVDPEATEGTTVTAGAVSRRAVAAPRVGHVGVLYSPTTLAEARDWIADAMGRPPTGAIAHMGPWLLALLAALVVLFWPLAGLLGRPERPARRPWTAAVIPLAAPVAPALASAVLFPAGVLGISAFGGLAAFFATWGAVQLAVLWRMGVRPHPPTGLAGLLLLLIWGLAVFAPLLDRYGAAFIPTGPRLVIMGLLVFGTVPYCLADAVLTRGLSLLPRLFARLLPILVLVSAMFLQPGLGIAFTVLPVMVLFWGVYGLAARWVAARKGSSAAGIALGIILAWAIAASTPLIAA